MRARIAVLGGLVLVFLAAISRAEPNFPPLTGPVVDEAGVLDAAARGSLEERLRAYQDKTGHQVVVATVRSLEGYDVRDYGNRLFRAWGIGDKKRNDGVLVLVAPNERDVSIEVGYGLEGDLTDALSRVIIDNAMLPRFKAGDYAGGVAAGFDDIATALGGNAGEIIERTRNQSEPDPGELLLIFLLLAVALTLLSQASRGRRIIIVPGPGGTYGGGYGGGWSGGGGWGGGYSGGGGSSGGGGASGSW